MADRIVSARHLVKIYDSPRGSVQALRGIDLAASAGSVTAVVGPSGSGKSSLLRILAGVDTPTAGEVVIGGVAVGMLRAGGRRRLRRAHVGFIAQRPADNLEPGIPLAHQVARAARFRGITGSADLGLLDRLGLAGHHHHTPDELSGGEQQRAAAARALAGRPALLLADEPTAELDREATEAVCTAIRSMATEDRLAAVIATHDRDVMATADHVIQLRDGAIQSETFAGEERAVVDGTGRVQLPPHVLEWYAERRVRLEIDPETKSVTIWPA